MSPHAGPASLMILVIQIQYVLEQAKDTQFPVEQGRLMLILRDLHTLLQEWELKTPDIFFSRIATTAALQEDLDKLEALLHEILKTLSKTATLKLEPIIKSNHHPWHHAIPQDQTHAIFRKSISRTASFKSRLESLNFALTMKAVALGTR